MKANISKKNETYKTMLTIGMIVKNEEASLESCLAALKPLREAVCCELIITDTGSTDRTVEIAEKYADKVLHFTWCNDFAAARNTTVRAMSGQWYMYLDADEVFDESISEIARFFNSGDYKNYDTATYIQRNYNDFQHQSFQDYRALRLRRNDQNLRFSGSIHEQLPATEPIFQLEAVAHHEGYITLHVGNLTKNKAVRNKGLLEAELKKKPGSARLYRHLADCFLMSLREQWEEKERCLKKGIETEADGADGIYGGSLEVELAKFYLQTHRPDDLNRLLTEWFHRPHPAMMADCELYFIAGQQAFLYKHYEDAIVKLTAFLELYEKYQKNELGMSVNMVVIHYATPQGLRQAMAMIAVCSARLGREEDAKSWMRKAAPGESVSQNGKPLLLEVLCEYLTAVPDTQLLEETYRALWKADHVFTQRLVCGLEKAFPAPYARKQLYLGVLAEKGESGDASAALARLKLSGYEDRREQDMDIILHDQDALENEAFAEAVYAALLQPEKAEAFFHEIPARRAPAFSSLILTWHAEFARRVYGYMQHCGPSGDCGVLGWRVQLCEDAITANNDFSAEEWSWLLEEYAKQGDAYCRLLYREEIWCEDGAPQLPRNHAYLFYLGMALEKKRAGDGTGYLKYLRLGLRQYEKMKSTSEYLLKTVQDEWKKQEKEQARQKDEMAQLKKHIKQNIHLLAAQGNLAGAKELLCRYEVIDPQDPEIFQLRRALFEITGRE